MAKSNRNPFLKRANEQLQYTAEQVVELGKCMTDPEYFIDTYCMLQHSTEGSMPFKLRPYQRKMVRLFADNRLSIALAPRQIGKSWIAGAYLLWYAMFKFEQTVVIASNKNDNAMEMIHRVRFIYERLPHWLKPGLTEDGWNKHSVGFDNGSRIISQATSENTGRGLAVSLFFLDEFAFVRDSIAEEFWTSASPTIATGGRCIICSTPNGDMNRFAQLWRGANIPSPTDENVGVNGFAAIEIKWNEPPGRDQKFKEEETAKIGELRWLQEYECRFLSNDHSLIDQVALENLTGMVADVRPFGVMGEIVFYKEPVANSIYLVGMDPSTGSGSDFCGIVAYEFPSLEQVAEFRSNTTSSVVSYHMLKKLLKIFERAKSTVYFSVENNGVGEAVMALLEADDNPPETAEFISETGQKRRGMTTSGKSKIKACLAMKEMIERSSLIVRSKVLVAELKHFVRSKGSYAAKRGSTDDLVMATLIAVRLLEEIAMFDQNAYDKLYAHAFIHEDLPTNYDQDGDGGVDGMVLG
jgi:Terminase RNaseH-like domain/Terminase large subunit, T4likevirus-type, N-terminal